MNERDVAHEVLVISVSYLFIYAGAWNDGLLGFTPSLFSRAAEYAMAAALAVEVIFRIRYTSQRRREFWPLVALDIISVLTIFPFFEWITLARVGRMIYAASRLMRLLDRLACQRGNGMYITAIFPFVVPILAAAVFAIERHSPSTTVHNYGDALRMCFGFALSLGNVRPVSSVAMGVCGSLFLLGLLTIGVLTNTISARYQKENET
ncbi:MAG TPA: hypothetical protein VGC72_03965 [Candidatus Elarobacter sp.]